MASGDKENRKALRAELERRLTAAGDQLADIFPELGVGASGRVRRQRPASARARGSPRRSNAAPIAAAHPGSSSKPSSIDWPGACRQRKSPASWGSHAEPSTRPGLPRQTARDDAGQVRGHAPERCHPPQGVTPQARPRYVLQHVHICTFGPSGLIGAGPRRTPVRPAFPPETRFAGRVAPAPRPRQAYELSPSAIRASMRSAIRCAGS